MTVAVYVTILKRITSCLCSSCSHNYFKSQTNRKTINPMTGDNARKFGRSFMNRGNLTSHLVFRDGGCVASVVWRQT
jgi:hypothetical protein